MLLRVLVTVLVLANVGYFFWSRQAAPAEADAAQREPQRMTQQVRPDALSIRGQ